MDIWQHLASEISTQTGQSFTPKSPQNIAGGCINQAVKLSDGQHHWFVKLQRAEQLAMFEAEAEGLAALADSQSIGVPRALMTGQFAGQSYLVLPFIQSGPTGSQGHALAGERLATMHRHSAEAFGWYRDNTIGATPQINTWNKDWIVFWRDQRLGFQLELAANKGYGGRLQTQGEKLRADLAQLIDHAPAPSLLHGDLWGGNITFDQAGEPVIFDPAVYYGDREADLAMTELFGGFSPDFYAAYKATWPLPPGYLVRKHLYNLYHILNHLNLFGGGYADQASKTIDRLLAAI